MNRQVHKRLKRKAISSHNPDPAGAGALEGLIADIGRVPDVLAYGRVTAVLGMLVVLTVAAAIVLALRRPMDSCLAAFASAFPFGTPAAEKAHEQHELHQQGVGLAGSRETSGRDVLML